MTPTDRQEIAAYWLVLAQMHGKEIATPVMTMMLDAVSDLPPPKVLAALRDWLKTSKHPRHPYPAEIRELVSPPVDSKFFANDVARKIDKALGAHGYTWENGAWFGQSKAWETKVNGRTEYVLSFKDAVIAELGEIAWHAICARGGWQNLISSQKEMDEGQFIAQLRDQIQASYALQKQGVDVTQIQLPPPPEPRGSGGLQRYGELKLISDPNKGA